MIELNTIHLRDCIEAMNSMNPGSVDLAFADPPFNIGYKYDVYEDRKKSSDYLDWSQKWISAVHRVLAADGSFWLAIGDEYAAELKIKSQEIGFHCRSWVVWYYTFGVNCKKKFSRSHAHIFHFVKDSANYQFHNSEIAVPSARQLVYADSRAAAGGRLPDDTWILRPQDLSGGFNPDEDTWYFPRVAGTFKEREGFHGCQMPEQLLGRIIRVASKPGDLVLDPFSGSSTTLTVAKKLGRRFVGFDISEEYIARGLSRLAACESGDRLDGSPEPTVSAPATPSSPKGRGKLDAKKKQQPKTLQFEPVADSHPQKTVGQPAAERTAALIEAFRRSSDGYSADRVVADPDLDQRFLDNCLACGLEDSPAGLNRSLFQLRKSGNLQSVPTTRRTEFSWADSDPYLFASEIAWRQMHDATQASMDQILCDPQLAQQFDQIARQFAPGFTSLQYRWAALKLRKAQQNARIRAMRLAPVEVPKGKPTCDQAGWMDLQGQPGLYVVSDGTQKHLYVGETFDLGRQLQHQFGDTPCRATWAEHGTDLKIGVLPSSHFQELSQLRQGASLGNWLVAYQFQLATQITPRLNSLGLESVV